MDSLRRSTKLSSRLLFFVFLSALVTAAQDNLSPLPGVFGEVLDVRVVNLEVVVTDRDGIPVRGLLPEDFILKVDGEEVAIEYFSEIRGGFGIVPARAADRDGVAEVPAIVPGSPIGTSYLLFIDDYFSIRRDRNRVLTFLMDDLPLLGPEDRMAIVAFDGHDLEMLSIWTNSVPALERALKKARLRPAHGLVRIAESRQFDFDQILGFTARLQSGFGGADDFFRTQLTPIERHYVTRLTEQVERTVAAAMATLRSFAQPPGRKTMILLSGGWPFLPAEFLGSNAARFVLASDMTRGAGLFRPLSDTANLLGYTLYPVDVPGFRNDLLDASSSVPADLSGLAPSTVGPLSSASFLREQELHYTLDFLAQETGGRAFLNARRGKVFAGVVADTRSYYWIGFSPQRAWDDQRHDLKVEVRHPKLRVRSREGFLDSSRQHEVIMAVESTLLFGSPPGEESLRVALGKPRKAGRGKMEVPLSVLVPLDQVTFLPIGGRQVTQLELRIAVKDEEGRRADIPVIPVVLQFDRVPAEGQFGRYETRLRLRRELHQAVVAIYDPVSGRILSATTQIRP